MKTFCTILLLVCLSASAQFSPVRDNKGFIGGYFRGSNCVFTNVSFNLANGTTYGVFDEFGGFIFLDYAGNQRFVWDPSSDDWSLISTNGTVKIEVDHNNKLSLNNPVIVGTITGNGSGLTNISGASGVTFNSTQFGSSAAGTNLLSGVLLTNAVNRIADETIFLKDSSGNSLMSWDSDNTDLKLFANVIAANGGFVGHGANITNLNASNLSSGTVNRAVTNGAVKTGDLVVTNNATVSGNLSVAGTFNVGTLNATNFTVTNPWNASNATNIQATNILSTFSLGNIAGGFGGNSFWLGQNAVLIGENFSGAAFDSRLAAATAQGGSSAFIGNPSGMTGSSTWRLSSYPTNTGSYAVIRYAPSGSPGINFSNRFCMDTSLMMGRVDLLQLSVGAVSDAIAIATTDSIRWLANTNWSANWIAECTSNSVSSYFTSSIPWAIDAKMMFSIDCTPTAARFYTNGILATTITTNIPVGRAVTPALRTMATANTGAATISSTYFDYVWVLIH